MIGSDDLAGFFRDDDFAEEAILNGQSVLGIFTDAYAGDSFGQLSVENVSPTFLLPSNLIPAGVEGMTLEIRGATYSVHRAEPDGTGVAMLILGDA